jgi:uncharacterized protein YbjT (DUF2867 family)
VRVSLVNAGADASFEWGRLHGAADAAVAAYCGAHGIEHCIVKSAPLLQSFALLHRWSIDAEGAIYAPLGDARVAFVDAGDVAAAVAVVATRGAGQGCSASGLFLCTCGGGGGGIADPRDTGRGVQF